MKVTRKNEQFMSILSAAAEALRGSDNDGFLKAKIELQKQNLGLRYSRGSDALLVLPPGKSPVRFPLSDFYPA